MRKSDYRWRFPGTLILKKAFSALWDRRTSMNQLFNELLQGFRHALAARFLPNLRDFLGDRAPLIWALGLATGISVGYAALAFRSFIGWVQYPWLFDMSENLATAARHVPFWHVLLAPAIGGLIVGVLLDRYVIGKRAHGPADVIEAGHKQSCEIDPKTGLWSAFLAVISLGSGASVGREGPMVHLGATIAASLNSLFQLKRSARRTILACGTAAAVSASFNAPIAGVLFAHEVILAHYAIRSLVPIVISSVTAAIISRFHFGDFPAFRIPEYAITSYLEFPAFAILGLVCAAVAIIFQTSLMTTERLAWRFNLPLWARGGLGGLLVGAIAVVFPEVLGVGYEPVNDALSQKLTLGFLIALIVAKTAATSISLASRAAGGVFSPSLYIGAMTGAAFGIIATGIFPEFGSSHGLYALLGMGGVAAAVLGAPISTVMIVFELTGGFEMTIALLLTVSISIGISYAFLGHSYFHWQLDKRGVPLHDGPHRSIMRRMTVRSFMVPLTPADDKEDASASSDDEAVALDEDAPRLLATDTLEHALKVFSDTGQSRIAVVAPYDQDKLTGWAHRFDAINAFNQAMINESIEQHR